MVGCVTMVVSSSKVNNLVGERRPAGQLVNLQSCILKIESSGVNFNNELVRMRLPNSYRFIFAISIAAKQLVV